MPSLSQSVRACSRRWSKYCMLSACSGAISRSMNASISASSPGRCSGRAKSTFLSLRAPLVAVQSFLPDRRQRGDRVLVADFQAKAFRSGAADEHGGEVLEQQGDCGSDVLGVQVAAVALLLSVSHGRGDNVHAEASKFILNQGESPLGGGQL